MALEPNLPPAAGRRFTRATPRRGPAKMTPSTGRGERERGGRSQRWISPRLERHAGVRAEGATITNAQPLRPNA
jgi:hypothetical protein